MSFFTARRRPVPAIPLDPPATDALTAHRSPVDPDTPPRPTPVPSIPSRASQAPPLRTWLTAEFGEVERVREAAVLDELADRAKTLGSWLAAAQSLYAPHLMETPNA